MLPRGCWAPWKTQGRSRVGAEGGSYGRTLGSRSGSAPEKLGAFGLPLSLSTPPGPPLKNWENITPRLKVKVL